MRVIQRFSQKRGISVEWSACNHPTVHFNDTVVQDLIESLVDESYTYKAVYEKDAVAYISDLQASHKNTLVVEQNNKVKYEETMRIIDGQEALIIRAPFHMVGPDDEIISFLGAVFTNSDELAIQLKLAFGLTLYAQETNGASERPSPGGCE